MTDVSIESVSHVVGRIYEAAYDQERWLDVMTGLRDLLGGSRACIIRFDPETADAVSTSADPEMTSSQIIAALLRDPVYAAAIRVPVGAIYKRTQIAGEDFLRRELWQEWFRPRDMYDGLVVNLMSSQDSLWQIDVHRGARQEAFDATEIELLQKLIPHVLRAGEIGRSIQKTSALASAFSHLPFGILLVDGHHRVCQMNDAAEVMLARPDSPLLLKSGVVAASSPEDTRNLQRLVLDACSLEDGAMPGVGGTLVLPSGHDGFEAPRLSLSVAPYFNAHAFGLASGRCAVVMIRELPNRGSSSSAEHVRQVFGLTNAEAKLAASLATGQSLREAAAAQRIQFGTARYYLAQIFRKTNTHRQSELVDLLRIAQPLWRLG